MTQATNIKQLLRKARRGPVRARDLDALGIPRTYLKRMCDEGKLEQVARGLYRLAGASSGELGSLADVAARVPRGVVCLLSALQLHGLTTETPHAVWLMIQSSARMPALISPKLEVVRASGQAFTYGQASQMIDGVRVYVTNPAKTVADCFRYRRHVGLDVALAALRDYLRKRSGTIDALVTAARVDRVYAFMRPYIEASV